LLVILSRFAPHGQGRILGVTSLCAPFTHIHRNDQWEAPNWPFGRHCCSQRQKWLWALWNLQRGGFITRLRQHMCFYITLELGSPDGENSVPACMHAHGECTKETCHMLTSQVVSWAAYLYLLLKAVQSGYIPQPWWNQHSFLAQVVCWGFMWHSSAYRDLIQMNLFQVPTVLRKRMHHRSQLFARNTTMATSHGLIMLRTYRGGLYLEDHRMAAPAFCWCCYCVRQIVDLDCSSHQWELGSFAKSAAIPILSNAGKSTCPKRI